MLNVDNKTKFSFNKIVTFCNIADTNVYNDIIYFGQDITEMLDDLQLKLQKN